MDISFKQYTEVKFCDAALRNAVRLDCAELVQRAIAKGGDVNCRYAEDWNTPLHLAIIYQCQSSVINELMNHTLDYGLVNGDNFTACELALRNDLRDLGRAMIVKEFECVEDPVDAIYEMLKRNSVEALEVLIEVLGLSGYSLAECLSKAWNNIEIMNVMMNPEVKVFVHMTLISLDYSLSIGSKQEGSSQNLQAEAQDQINLLITEISLIEQKYDTGLCHDITDEFLEVLRLILKHMFVVKNKVDKFPAMQLEYCIAMYLAIFDRKPDLDLYQLVINKRLLIEFLKLFKSWHNNPWIDQRMSCELLHTLIQIMFDNKDEISEQTIEEVLIIAKPKYTKKEVIMIRSKILKSDSISKLQNSTFNKLTKTEYDLLKIESDRINNMFEHRKSKYLYKNLNKTFFKLKQMYSLQKSVQYLNVIKMIDLNPVRSCYVEMLAVQRVIQVLGETLKSTKLSPNISSNLKSILEFVSPGELLKWISKLRQYFSHNYSFTKHALYRRLRTNDPELINFFKRVKADLLKVVPLLSNIFTDYVYRLFKGFLGYVLTLKSVEHVRSYAKASRVRLGFKLDHEFQSSDLVEIKKQLADLKQHFNPECHSSNLEVIAKINSRIDSYVNFLNGRSINFMTEMVLSCIGELLLCDRLVYQRNVARFYLKSSFSPKSGGYGAATFLMQSCNPLIRELLTMEAKIPDENSLKRTTMIQDLLKLANVEDIRQLHELTLVSDKSLTNISKDVCKMLVDGFVSANHFKQLDKLLQKYYANMFAVDDKYRIVKNFCKSNKLIYNTEAAAQCRKKDKQELKKVLSDLIQDMTDILSLPENMKISDLVPLIACCEVYETDNIEMFALETILFEVLEILSSQGVLTDNRFMLMSYRSVVSGRNLRNYLAHDGLVYETVCRNSSSGLTLMINAICLTKYSDVELYLKRASVSIQNSLVTVTDMNEWTKQHIYLKSIIFDNIENDIIDLLISDDTELSARDYTDRTVLMSLIDNFSEQFIYYLLGRSSKVRSLVEKIVRRGLIQEHNFYDDDEFTLAKLISHQNIRDNMSFYLSLKNHHFELEQEIDLLGGGAYNEDSLHMAIIFENEKSALSIIDDSRLYSFCKHDAWNYRNTILTLAVLHKLPNVVRRICETSPDLIERTNTSQETPLRIATATSCKEIVEILLEFGAQIFNKNKPPIINALQVRKDELLDIMLPSNDELLNNETLLNQLIINAGTSNHTKILVKLLPIVKSRSILIKSLYSAVSNNQLKAAQVLLDFDASIVNELNEFESTALFTACYSGHDALAKMLIERGADCSVPNQNSPLQCAIDMNRYNQFKMMVQRGITDLDLRNRLFQDLFDLSRFNWIWTALRAGVPCNLAIDQSVVRKVLDNPTLEFLFNLIRFRKDLIQQIDTYTLANAVLLRKYKFVKFVLERLETSYDRTRLLNCAVKANDKEMVCLLIEAGCSVNSADAYGITPLATAVTVGKPDMVKVLVKFQADPNLESMGNCDCLLDAWNILSDNIFEQLGGEYYRTYPLILAAMHSFVKIAEYLLKSGAKADIRDQSGFTPLIAAVSHGDTELVDALIQNGANVDYCRNFSHSIFKDGSALHFTAIYGHFEMAKLMIEEYHFDHKAKDSDGNTALHLAIINGQANFVEYFLTNDKLWEEPNNCEDTPLMLALKHLNLPILQLIKSKPKCKETVREFRGAENRSLLHMAVLKGSADVLQVLLREFDIDCCWMDQFGHTALYYAVLKKNCEFVKLIMEAGSSLTGPCQYSTMPPFVVAVLSNQLDIVKLYIEKEKEAIQHLKEYSSNGRNLLVSSVMQNNFAMCKLLLKSIEFDLNVAYEIGYTAIQVAATKHSVRMVDLLIHHGSNIDQINQDGKTALIMAIENGNCREAHYLLQKGSSMQIAVDYRFSDESGMNLLHYVAYCGKLNSLKFLIDREFFTRTSTDANGKTIGHYAASNKQHAVIEFLISSQFPLDQLDNDGRSALMCALENEDVQLAKRLKSIGSSLDVVQLYINKNYLLTKALRNNNMDLIKFLTDDCSITICSIVENMLFNSAKAAQNKSPTDNLGSITGFQNQYISPIIQHILDNNIENVKQLIDDVSSLEAVRSYRMPTRDQETLLHVTARKGYLSMLALLLEKGVFDIDIGDVDQTTALQDATMTGRKECINLLLQHGANINFVDLQNTTALTRACVNSQKEIAELLLNLGADTANTKAFHVETREGATALHIAILRDLSLMELLVKRIGININTVDACGRTVLHIASQIGSIQAAEESLRLGACADLIDQYRRTAFVTALESGHEEVAERLLVATQDKEYLRDFRMEETLKSVLHIALEKGFDRMISLLLNNYGLDCNCTDFEGKSILHYAVAGGNESLIRQLKIDLGMLSLKDNTGETPISICVNQSNLEIFALLIEPLSISGTVEFLVSDIKKVSYEDYTKFTNLFSRWLLTHKKSYITENQSFVSMVSHVYNVDPLLYAIHGDHRDLLDLFLKSGFDRSMLKDSTWLHIAALKNLHYLAKVMLDELKTNVDCIDDYGRTPLYYAVTIPQKETAKLLLERGANVNFQDATKRTPLQTALEFNNKEMVQLLLEHHADIGLLQEFRYLNENEHLVQHYLVERGLTEMLTLILSEIDVMHVDKHGMTPLHYAAGCNQLEMIELLVNAGAEVDCFDVHKTTPLMRAISKNHLEAYHKLVSLGANVDLARQFRNNNFDGESILHIAAEKNRIEAMKFLVEELKCDVDCIDKNGNTPLHYALQKGCFEVVKYLLGKNANLHLKNNNDQSALQLLEESNFDVKSTEN